MKRVLFLCSPEDPHSLMAEALLRHIDCQNFEAVSAVTLSQPLHPISVEIMKEIGVSLGQTTSKTLDELRGQTFDFVITLDEVTAKQTPFVNSLDTVHWKFESPRAVLDEEETQRRAFRSLRDQIAQRLRLFAIVHTREGVPAKQTPFAEAATTR